MPPASLGGFPRSVSGPEPGPFQISASSLGLKVCEILCVSFKSEFLFPTFFQLSCMQALLAFKARHSEGLSSWCRTLGLESPVSGLDPLILGETSAVLMIFPLVGCLSGGLGLVYSVSPPLLPISSWFLFLYL